MKRNINRFLLAMLLTTMLCSWSIAYGEEVYFSTTLLKAVNNTPSQWMSTTESQASFAACAILDYSIQENIPYELTNVVNSSFYVGRSSSVLTLGINDHSKKESLLIVYDTNNVTEAAYSVYPLDQMELETGMKKLNPDGYYEVDIYEIKRAMDTIVDVLR